MVSVQQFSSWNTWNTSCEARTEEHAFIFCVFNGLLQLPFSWFLAQHGGFESTLRIACGGSCAEGSPWHRRYSKMALSCQHYSKFYLNLVEIFRCWAWSECLFELWSNFIARCLTPRFQSWEARGEDPQHQGTAAIRRLRLSVTPNGNLSLLVSQIAAGQTEKGFTNARVWYLRGKWDMHGAWQQKDKVWRGVKALTRRVNQDVWYRLIWLIDDDNNHSIFRSEVLGHCF